MAINYSQKEVIDLTNLWDTDINDSRTTTGTTTGSNTGADSNIDYSLVNSIAAGGSATTSILSGDGSLKLHTVAQAPTSLGNTTTTTGTATIKIDLKGYYKTSFAFAGMMTSEGQTLDLSVASATGTVRMRLVDSTAANTTTIYSASFSHSVGGYSNRNAGYGGGAGGIINLTYDGTNIIVKNNGDALGTNGNSTISGTSSSGTIDVSTWDVVYLEIYCTGLACEANNLSVQTSAIIGNIIAQKKHFGSKGQDDS